MAQSFVSIASSSTRLATQTSTHVTYRVPIFLAPRVVNPSLRRQSTFGSHPSRSKSVHIRHASSTSAPAPGQTSSSNPREAINPPASTRPPPLDTPVRGPDQSTPSYLFALGKCYINFYKTGLKAVWGNYKLAREISGKKLDRGKIRTVDAARQGLITRSEYFLLKRSSSDARKIPLFGLVLMMCGEFTPLVVLALSGIVPQTCHIPKQVHGERKKLEERRKQSFQNGDSVADSNELESGTELQGPQTIEVVQKLRWEQLLHISRSLGLYAKLWDTLWDYPPQGLLRKRVQRALEGIQVDDDLIKRHGGIAHMDPEETRIAAEERGIDILGRSDADVKAVLEKWTQARKRQSISYLVLTRPNVWKTT